jgi:signal transduction histidine kinase
VFKKTSIRMKLLAVLIVPVVVIAGISWIQVRQADAKLADVRDETSLALVSAGPGGLIFALQDERNDGSATMAGVRSAITLRVKNQTEARRKVDAAAKSFTATVNANPRAKVIFAGAIKSLDDIPRLRGLFDGLHGKTLALGAPIASAHYEGFSKIISSLVVSNEQLQKGLNDPVLRTRTQLLAEYIRWVELTSQISRYISNDIAAGKGTTKEKLEGYRLYSLQNDSIGNLWNLANPAEKKIMRGGMYGNSRETVRHEWLAYLETGVKPNPLTLLKQISTLQHPNDTDAREFFVKEIDARTKILISDAEHSKSNYFLLALLTTLVGLLLAVVGALSISRPLKSLTGQAEFMAVDGLPAAVKTILDTPLGDDVVVPVMPPIKVRTRDEVSEVAAALNTVQTSALNLAVEQAVLRRHIADSFVNLGRRNQNLIGRQLDFITDLERNETDPEQLDNLFRLDHLATRIRRNAESLVVLAGLEPPRTWSAPIAAGDVVRASLGEVEDYRRVEIEGMDPAMVSGGAATDLVHLSAELIENALTFSPPDTLVRVMGHNVSGGGYIMTIADEGLGMSAEEISVANGRLAGNESFTVAPSRYLGHYVAGHLARRHGVTVTLEPSSTKGITVRVTLPAALLDIETEPTGPAPVADDIEARQDTVEVTHPADPLPSDDLAPAGSGLTIETTEDGLARRVSQGAVDGPTLSPGEGPRFAGPEPLPADEAGQFAEVGPSDTLHGDLPAMDEMPAELALTEAPASAEGEAPGELATPDGLQRRVRGANFPGRGAGPIDGGALAERGRRANAETIEGGGKATPLGATPDADSVRNLLSSFTSGVERGHAEAEGNASDEPTTPATGSDADPDETR